MQYYRSGWSVSIEGYQRTQACSHFGKAGAPPLSLVSPSTRSACRVVIDDLHIDPTVDGPLELVKNRRHT
jgi:hypothetical protein